MDIKNEIIKESEKIFCEANSLSHEIHRNPELAFNEYKASKLLSDFLKKNEFIVQYGLKDLNTAFRAVYDSKRQGPNICFMAEYDALPEIGHACGHNIIGSSSCASAVVLKNIISKYNIGGKITVMGTPAEENGSGKVLLIDRGEFEGIDAAILMHPADNSMPDDISFACAILKYTFTGVPAHAAAVPWMGRSALNTVVQMYNSVNAMRLHLKDYSRVHAYIDDGGSAHNTIVDKSSIIFNIRSLTFENLKEIIKIVDDCAKGAAISTGTKFVKSEEAPILKEIKNNKTIVNYVRENMRLAGEEFIERDLTQGIGSTDVANVTHEIPAIQYYIKLAKNTGTHTIEFEKAAGDKRGERCLLQSIKVSALTGYDLLMGEII